MFAHWGSFLAGRVTGAAGLAAWQGWRRANGLVPPKFRGR